MSRIPRYALRLPIRASRTPRSESQRPRVVAAGVSSPASPQYVARAARSVLQEPTHALEGLVPRIDTRLLFPGPGGAFYDLRNFRRREFTWARDAAGLAESATLYSLRHSGISWALAAGVPPSDVAKFGGTSIVMLEKTYAHLLASSAANARVRMDEFMAATEEAEANSEEGPRADQSR